MRTTLTLDPDVVRLLEAAAHRLRLSFKELVNDALRRALAPRGKQSGSKRYRVRPHAGKLRPGLDRARLNSLADELEDQTVLAKHRRRRGA
ncbi:MAG: CopG family transcriptional regulator [Planctomycetota bacterium]